MSALAAVVSGRGAAVRARGGGGGQLRVPRLLGRRLRHRVRQTRQGAILRSCRGGYCDRDTAQAATRGSSTATTATATTTPPSVCAPRTSEGLTLALCENNTILRISL